MEVPWTELTRLSTEVPLVVRAVVGVLGLLLLLAGARLYKAALFGSAFALGAVPVALLCVWLTPQVAAIGRPEVVALASLVAGLGVVGIAAMAHRLALLAVGGVTGIALGAGVGSLVGGQVELWAPLGGALVGALLFPFVFQGLLKLVTPLVGAVCIAFAAMRPEQLWLMGLLWGVGIVVQVGLLPKKREPPESEA